MNTTCCIGGQIQGTHTPIAYHVDQTIRNGQNNFTEWLFEGRNTIDLFCSCSPLLGVIGIKSNNGNQTEYESLRITTKENSVLEKIENRIFRIAIPSHWSEEGVAPPNMASKVKAFDIVARLFRQYDLMPDRIGPTKEEGIALFYDSTDGFRTLLIEVYNDLEAGYLINDNAGKKILASNDVFEPDFREAVELFNE